jgi:hypothetical protein
MPTTLRFVTARHNSTVVPDGTRFGRLITIALYQETGRIERRLLCVCDCGTIKDYAKRKLTSGRTRSCGCLKREKPNNLSHGHNRVGERTSEYGCWVNIRTRCYNPKEKRFESYGGRGITVCDRWLESFENFLADMGPKPSPELSIERINNDGNYEPGNCKWATRSEQMHNRRPFKHKNRQVTNG